MDEHLKLHLGLQDRVGIVTHISTLIAKKGFNIKTKGKERVVSSGGLPSSCALKGPHSLPPGPASRAPSFRIGPG